MNPVGAAQLNGAGELKALASEDRSELKRAVADFEALFIQQILKSMRETIDKGDLFHGGSGEEVYTSLLDAELSKDMARSGGIGLSEMLLRQLSDGEAAQELRTGLPPRVPAVEKREVVSAPPPEPEATPVLQAPTDQPFSYPVRAFKRISSDFGLRIDPITGAQRFHHGIDIAARQGTPVYPAAPGRVIFSGERGGYGNMVEVLHGNGYVTRYGHNQKNLVKEGDRVDISSPIAYVGSTGRSTGPHLHFEVLKAGTAINPDTFYG